MNRIPTILLATLVVGLSAAAVPASAHRASCHRAHSCPSDHATYKWKGKLCVSPASGESRTGYPQKVRYGGRVYYCKK